MLWTSFKWYKLAKSSRFYITKVVSGFESGSAGSGCRFGFGKMMRIRPEPDLNTIKLNVMVMCVLNNALSCMSSRFNIDLLQRLFLHMSCIVIFLAN